MALTCPDCHRKLPRPRTSGASPDVKAVFEATMRICRWCLAKKLLAGGFEPVWVQREYEGQELKLLREEAAALRRELLKPKARRRAEKKTAPTQGMLS